MKVKIWVKGLNMVFFHFDVFYFIKFCVTICVS
jgi:hypothetical protein